MVVQALWESKSVLLQLPHIEESMLRHFVDKKVRDDKRGAVTRVSIAMVVVSLRANFVRNCLQDPVLAHSCIILFHVSW